MVLYNDASAYNAPTVYDGQSFATVALRAASSAGSATTVASLAITIPSTAVANDLLVLALADSTATQPTAPAG